MLIPFAGSGMTIAAGAPSVPDLARDLARRTDVPVVGEWPDLPEIVSEAERRHGIAVVRRELAEIATGWLLHPTPALIAICGTPTQRVVTTNYDDAIERSAIARGLMPVPLLPRDPRILQVPGPNELHVIHLHGLPGDPESLILPGRTTEELEHEEVFQTFIRSRLAAQGVVHLGFSFAGSEVHLHSILAWLNQRVKGAGHHYVLLPGDEIGDRSRFDPYDMVTVVPYVKDPDRTEVERVCVAFAPRVTDPSSYGTGVTWVAPVLMSVGSEDDEDRLRQRLSSFDLEIGGGNEVVSVPELMDRPRVLVVAGPGMGKSTMLERLSDTADEAAAIAPLADFAPARADDPPELAIAHLLRDPRTRERLPIDVLEGAQAQLLLDGLDEVDQDLAGDAVDAIGAAVEAWPDHTWVIASRPTSAEPILRERGFAVFHIMASHRWARRYLETRGVPPQRVRRAMLDGYGLGALTTTPLFAARLADRLLDDHLGEPWPLHLLVDEQLAATAREAVRGTHREADLACWMRSLAVALQLRGRASAARDELAGLPGPAGVTGTAARERLVTASLLADRPGVAAFPHKALQEALCARAILDAGDPVALLRETSVADVDGVARLRDDWELTVDLVFEHAEPDVRRSLRDLDEQRWAGTVVTRGDLDEARQALGTIWAWHEQRRRPFGTFGDGGLRTAATAVQEIVRRWPALVEERRAEFERDVRSTDLATCERALVALGALPADRPTEWLLRCLNDGRPQVLTAAARLAGVLRVKAAVPRLMDHVASPDRNVRTAALTALVELAPMRDLPDVAAGVVGQDALRPIYRRLLERVDVDIAIAVAQRAGQLTATTAWLLERVIDEAHPDAWTPARVEALMRALEADGIDRPDPERVASGLAHAPDRAIAAVRIRPVGDGPWGPTVQMLALSHLDPRQLVGDDHADLRAAIARAVEDERQRRERADRPHRALIELGEAIDRCGLDLLPEIADGVAQLRRLSDAHREILVKLVDRWWPTGGFPVRPSADATTEPEDLRRARVALTVGAELRAPLPADRWAQLLDGHLRADHRDEIGLGEDAVVGWLASTRPPDAEMLVAERIAGAADGEVLSHLIAISGRSGRPEALTAAAFARLAALGGDARWWSNAAALLLEDGHVEQGRALLDLPLSHGVRAGLIACLARAADPHAQRAELGRLSAAIVAGEPPETPHWWGDARASAPIDAVLDLADVALIHGVDDVSNFAITLIEARVDNDALAALTDLAARHGDRYTWLHDTVERHARRLATRSLLDTLPDTLGDAAAWFDTRSSA